MQSITVTPKAASELLCDALRAELVPMITSSPGVGKSSIAKQIADQWELELIDIRLSQCDPTDLNGFPTFVDGVATYAPMNIFPTTNTPIPEGKKGWLMILDEMNSAPMAVQAASYKIALDKMVGNHHLHPNVAIMAAGNLMTDRAIVNKLSTAMQSRLIHLQLEVNLDDWLDWAHSNGIDHRVISFVNFKPELLHSFQPDHQDKTFACPRTWEFLSRLITKNNWTTIEDSKLPLIAGTVSEGVAVEFLEFTKIYQSLPTIQEIVSNPTGFKLSDEPSTMYAISGLMSNHMNATNAPNIVKAAERLPIEFQVITLQGANRRDRTLGSIKEVRDWALERAKELM